MSESGERAERFRRIFLILLALAVSWLFFKMISGFLNALLMAAIMAGLSRPLYRWLVRTLRGSRAVASVITILLVTFVVLIPASVFMTILVGEAIDVTNQVVPWVDQQIREPSQIDRWIQAQPALQKLGPYEDQIVSKLGELASNVGTFLINTLAATTKGTAVFFFHLFVMLYAMFFFLMDGPRILDKFLYYMPLSPADEERMVEKFLSVSRATIKGTLIIGIVQGGLAGIAFWVVGIDGAVFWGTIMAILSIIPGVGTALVWIPAVIYLVAKGHMGSAIGLFVWCAAVVGTVDNVLRPWLVGKDTKMPDLLILLGTLGGLIVFGAPGIIIGPIIAALFVTIWDIYGTAFKDVLPATTPIKLDYENKARDPEQ
jgi:predicted PurR-regulated permease PerM